MADLNIPYDPDFDESSRRGGGPSPRQAFVAGLVTSVLIVCSLGFIILLILFFR